MRWDCWGIRWRTGRSSAAGYYGMVSLVNGYCGMVIDALERLGIREETVVIWTADHGDQQWEHAMFLKFNMREASVHVPLVIDAPGVSSGIRLDLVEHIDLFPTICDLMGADTPDSVQGRSLRRLLEVGKEEKSRWLQETLLEPRPIVPNQPPLIGGEPQDPVTVLVDGTEARPDRTTPSYTKDTLDQDLLLAIVPDQTTISAADPYVVIPVDTQDQAIGSQERLDGAHSRALIQLAAKQTVVGTHPQRTVFLFDDVPDADVR